MVDYAHDSGVEELGLVDRDHLGLAIDPLRDLDRSVDGDRFEFPSVMRTDAVDAPVAVVQMRLEDLDLLAGDHGSTDPAKKLFRLSAEHHAGYDLDPAAGVRIVEIHGVLGRRVGTCAFSSLVGPDTALYARPLGVSSRGSDPRRHHFRTAAEGIPSPTPRQPNVSAVDAPNPRK